MCVSVRSCHTSGGVSIRCENAATYSAGNEDQNICDFFMKPMRSRDQALTPLERDTKSAIFPAENTHAHCAYASSSHDVMLSS